MHTNRVANHLSNLDEAQEDAVASRIELDLRVGTSFARPLTLILRPVLKRDNLSEAPRIIKCESCQTPTLGLIVERYLGIRYCIPGPFWCIKPMH